MYQDKTANGTLLCSLKLCITEILAMAIFNPMLNKQVHSGVHKHKYQYHITTSHSTLATFSINIMHTSEFDQGTLHLNDPKKIPLCNP
jgi:hypothetical protein